jgi:hypothetical protein
MASLSNQTSQVYAPYQGFSGPWERVLVPVLRVNTTQLTIYMLIDATGFQAIGEDTFRYNFAINSAPIID